MRAAPATQSAAAGERLLREALRARGHTATGPVTAPAFARREGGARRAR